MGHGDRFDFTRLPQTKHDPGFIYDYDPRTIANRVKHVTARSRSNNSFGNAFNKYEKAMVVGPNKNHYMGKGPACNMGV